MINNQRIKLVLDEGTLRSAISLPLRTEASDKELHLALIDCIKEFDFFKTQLYDKSIIKQRNFGNFGKNNIRIVYQPESKNSNR